MTDTSLQEITADITTSYLQNNKLAASDLPKLIQGIYAALSGTVEPKKIPEELLVPAVSIRGSVKPDYIICLEDGKKTKLLRPYIEKHFGLTPAAYRERWNLPADYPMTAPSYVEKRRALAMEIGLGRRAAVVTPPAPVVEPVKPKRVAKLKPTPEPEAPATATTEQPPAENNAVVSSAAQPANIAITAADLEAFTNDQAGGNDGPRSKLSISVKGDSAKPRRAPAKV